MVIHDARRGEGNTFCIKYYSNETDQLEWHDNLRYDEFCNHDGYVLVQVKWNTCIVMNFKDFNKFVKEGW